MPLIYPVAIEPADAAALVVSHFGVVVPDLPGCVSCGETVEDALARAGEAIALWLAAQRADGGDAPQPSPIAALHRRHAQWRSWIWALVPAQPDMRPGSTEADAQAPFDARATR